jgi:hypothetical protein
MTITKEQWKRTPKDYKAIYDGKKYIMTMVDGVTTLSQVEVN